MPQTLLTRVHNRFLWEKRKMRVRRAFDHVAGPRRHQLAEHEVCAVILGKDVAFFLPELIRHHRALGVEHFLYIDNGSEDASLTLASREPGMLAVRTDLPYREYQTDFRRLAIEMFVDGGWVLILDADELFDYPGSERLPLPALTRQLDTIGHTAVVAQMIDMVPRVYDEGSLSRHYEEAIAVCRYFDIDHLQRYGYHDDRFFFSPLTAQNRVTNPGIGLMFGGIRGHLFGEECCLTKHPLVKNAHPADPAANPHIAAGVTCSDFTAMLRHYKFVDSFVARERQRIANNVILTNEPALRMQRFEAEPDLNFETPTLRTNLTPETLLNHDVLVASDRAREMLKI
ncbi:MAG: glycosyltransferase family 2 protein [Pseudomonadota bacterium]